MVVLWNGEYVDKPLTRSMTSTRKMMEEAYRTLVGTVVGDFTCLKAEYDWGRRSQRWTVKCNLCGEVSYRYHVKDWQRGKGQTIYCHCRKDRERNKKERERERKRSEKEERIKERLGKEYFGWRVIGYDGLKTCTVECVKCGIVRKNVRIDDIISGGYRVCTHRKPNDYSGDEWIGKKEGHLTTIGRDGMMFIAQCDCGEVIRVRPTDIFTSKRKRSCSSPNCPYCNEVENEVRNHHKRGFERERNVLHELISSGYDAEKTQDIADFGVDIIIHGDDGSKMAVQVKKENHPIGVEAMQEVYAGGRFYDCTKFAVISDSGFSPNAVKMARKLGIYCCEGAFDPPSDISKYAIELLPTHTVKENKKGRRLYEFCGEAKTLADWCAIYGRSYDSVYKALKRGVTLETALKYDVGETQTRKQLYTAFGKTGSLREICEQYDVVPETVLYRIRNRGLSLEEAILEPQKTGRPRKKHPADRQITQSANAESPD